MSNSRIPSPARSLGAPPVTPRRYRVTRSVGSSARSAGSGRLSSIVDQFKENNADSFTASPLNKTVTSDNTAIDMPRRRSWWRKVENSREMIQVPDNEEPVNPADVFGDCEMVDFSQEKPLSDDLPESSGSESIHSIIVPQRKLFRQQENLPQNFEAIASTTDATNLNLEDQSMHVGTKNLFSRTTKRTKPVFPSALLNITTDETLANKTKELPVERKAQSRGLFGNRPDNKRKKSIFADIVVSESEDESLDIQPKQLTFNKPSEPTRRNSNASSATTDKDLDDWKLLPSSTMVEHQQITQLTISSKKARLSKLSEAKESTNADSEQKLDSDEEIEKLSQHTVNREDNNDDNKKKEHELKALLAPPGKKAKLSQAEESDDLPESSGSESIHSIVLPQRKLFVQKENLPQKNFEAIANPSEATMPSLKDQTVHVDTKNLFSQTTKRTKPIFPSALLNVTTENTLVDKTKELPVDIKAQTKGLFGNRPGTKRKNIFADIVVSESEDESLDIQPRRFTFNKPSEPTRRSSNASSITAEIELDDWKLLPSSTMMEHQLEAQMTTPGKRDKLSKLSEAKESTNAGAEQKLDVEQSEHAISVENNDKIDESEKHEVEAQLASLGKSDRLSKLPDSNEPTNTKAEQKLDVEKRGKQSEHAVNVEYSDKIDKSKDNQQVAQLTTPSKSDRLSKLSKAKEPTNVEAEQKIDVEKREEQCEHAVNVEDNDKGEEHQLKAQLTTLVKGDRLNKLSEAKESTNAEAEQKLDLYEKREKQREYAVNMEDKSEGHQPEAQLITPGKKGNLSKLTEVKEPTEDNQELKVEVEKKQSDLVNEEGHDEIMEDENNDHVDGSQEMEASKEVQNDGEFGVQTDAELSHDTTGRNRKKREARTPEAILRDSTNELNSFTVKGRNTSIRKTIPPTNNQIRQSMAPARESTGLNDGTNNSSAEGSGWDSHRTTRKTLRQTFGKDFTPRKSLRALVMEKSAKRKTIINEANAVLKRPQANSTELPDNQEIGQNVEEHQIVGDHVDAEEKIQAIDDKKHNQSKEVAKKDQNESVDRLSKLTKAKDTTSSKVEQEVEAHENEQELSQAIIEPSNEEEIQADNEHQHQSLGVVGKDNNKSAAVEEEVHNEHQDPDEKQDASQKNENKDGQYEVNQENVEGDDEKGVCREHVEEEHEQDVSEKNVDEEDEQEVSQENVEEEDEQEMSQRNLEEEEEQEMSQENIEEEDEQEVSQENVDEEEEDEQEMSQEHVEEEDDQEVSQGNLEEEEEMSQENVDEEDDQDMSQENLEEEEEQEMSQENLEEEEEQEASQENLEEEEEQEMSQENVEEDDEQDLSQEIEEEQPHQSDTDVTPEAILKDAINERDSFPAKGRNTSIRKTIPKYFATRQSMETARESIGLSDGTKNSSDEGSGWDSHRTTGKSLRLTMAKGFSPRKSLRTMVMEKSAKRQTLINEANAKLKMHQANLTDLPDDQDDMEYEDSVVESDHEMSRCTRQAKLDMYIQNFKKENRELRQKIQEEIRNPIRLDILNRPNKLSIVRATKAKVALQSATTTVKAKRFKSSVMSLENLPPELVEDMKYKPPKRFKPRNVSWITKRLYKFLESKLEPKYDYKARVRAEKLVETIYNFTSDIKRVKVAPPHAVAELKREMARLGVVSTHHEFYYSFVRKYLPYEVTIKVIPDIINNIPVPQDVFGPII